MARGTLVITIFLHVFTPLFHAETTCLLICDHRCGRVRVPVDDAGGVLDAGDGAADQLHLELPRADAQRWSRGQHRRAGRGDLPRSELVPEAQPVDEWHVDE